MAYTKFIHLVWVGTGTPVAADLVYLDYWAAMREHGWTIYMWTDHPELAWIQALGRAPRQGRGFIESMSFTAPEVAREMTRIVGTTAWTEMLAVLSDINVLGEAVPFETREIRQRDGNAYALANLRNPGDAANRQLNERVPTDEAAARILDMAGWFGTDYSVAGDFGAKRKLKSFGANYAAASDIVRAIAMCICGGFYTDISAAPLPQAAEGGLRGRRPGAAFNDLAAEGSEATVLWNVQSALVNNAFLGANRPELPFWVYYFKSMHKIYKDLVVAPTASALTTYFTNRAASFDRRFNQRKLDARALLAGGTARFMFYMKRLAMRDLTLYCSGPYLLRACLDHFYLRRARSPLTVEQLCAYVREGRDATKKTAIEGSVPGGVSPVTFEPQNIRVKKIQRGSWDQSHVAPYFIEMFDARA